MIDKSSVKQSLLDLAEEVQDSDKGAAVRLRLLADTIESGQNADIWQSIDIYKMIDAASVVERYKSRQARGRLLDVLETVRNTLVLGPIIVTWFGISQATAQYNSFLKAHPDQASQPFLYLWEQRFGGSLPWFLALSNLALIDASILAVIFLMTLLVFSLAQASASRIEKKSQDLYANLVHTLAGAAICLASYRAGQPLQPLTAGDNLEGVVRRIDTMANEATRSIQAMVNQLIGQFNTLAGQITNRFDQMTGQVVGRLNSVAAGMEKQVKDGVAYLDKLNGFAGGLQQLSQEMKEAARGLEDANTELADSLNSLAGPAKALVDQQKGLVAVANDTINQLQGVAKTFTDLSKKQDRWGTDLTDALDALNLAVEKAMELATTVGNFTTQQSTFLQALEQERDAQGNLAKLMSDATVQVKGSLEDMDSGRRALRSIANDMHDILNMQKSSNTTDLYGTYNAAAREIERSGVSLSSSANAIYLASQKLTDAIDRLEQYLTTVK